VSNKAVEKTDYALCCPAYRRWKSETFYVLKIKDFSTESLHCIFDRHISRQAKITADE
jgi:hypothetical protein